MKTEYLNTLKELLDRYQMEEAEKQDIVNDYNDMYENYLDYGMSDQEVEEKLGKPKSIISSLTEGYKRVPTKQSKSGKLIALMPFIALIIFFITGFVYNAWEYSWMAFLLIPIVAIISTMLQDKDKNVLTALSPFAAVIAYFILGFGYNLWHPGWLVFLGIPVIAIIVNSKEMKVFELFTALSPFAAVLVYTYIGTVYDLWHPGWLVFLFIPAIGILNEKNIGRMVISEVLLLGGVAGYLYLGYNIEYNNIWTLAGFAFLPFIAYMIFIGNIKIWDADEDIPRGYKIVVLATLITYFAVSFFTGFWVISWLIFFAIPVYAILREVDGEPKIIAITPFVATTLFMVLGFTFGLWAWSWIAFLLIPVVAIIKS